MKFGLACEGITDYITIKNILRGCFPNINPKTQIRQLQPALDETDENQIDFGGWENLLAYLQSIDFYDALERMDFVIVQLDSDISEHKNFGVSHRENNKELSADELIENIKTKLITLINRVESGLYDDYAGKVIFAICVHSLECWLYAYYNTKPLKNPKITGCGKALNHLLNVQGFDGNKDKKLYTEYSKIFLKSKTIEIVAQKDASFNFFIQQLEPISP